MQIVLNSANFEDYEFGISNLYEVDSNYKKGEKNKFYYVHAYPMKPGLKAYTGLTSKSFTELLGDNAGKNDEKLCQVIAEHEGEYCFEALTDDDGTEVCFEGSTEVVYQLKKCAHSKKVAWKK